MADRPSRIRLMLQAGSFLGGLQQIGDKTRSIGLQLGRYLKQPVEAGLGAMKSSISSTVSSAKTLATTAAGIAGGFSVASSIKGGMQLQATYRDLANQINRLRDTGLRWNDVQVMIETTAARVRKDPELLAAAFKEVYAATGDLEYSRKAIGAIGTASRATGEDVVKLAMPIQLAARKFGVAASEVEEATARIIEKIGVGGADLDTLNMRFAVMAGEASAAGLKGKEGLSALLGIMLKLDSTIGEKASPGLKALFQYLKDNTSQLKGLEKQSGLKFEVDTSAFDKLRKIIGSAKGRKAAEYVFTADSRVVYDTLVEPFKQAFKAAKAKGASVKEATEAGYAAYDAEMAKMTASTAKFSKLQEQAADRLKNDPAAMMESAMLDLKLAFTKPEMIGAMKSLAEVLPPVVEGLTKLVDFTVKNPWTTAGLFVGGKAALAGGSAFTVSFAKKSITGVGAKIAADAAAHGAWSAAGGVLAKAAGPAIAVAAAAYIAYEIDKALTKREKGEARVAVGGAVAATGDVKRQREELAAAKEERERLKKGPDFFEKVAGGWANIARDLGVVKGGFKTPKQLNEDALRRTEKTIAELEAALKRAGERGKPPVGGSGTGTRAEPDPEAQKKASRALDGFRDATDKGSRDLDQFRTATADAARELRRLRLPEPGGGGGGGSNGLPPRAPNRPGYSEG